MSSVAQRLANLPPHVKALVEKIVNAATATNGSTFKAGHWFMNADLYALFGLKLGMYHAVTRSPLNKAAFEQILEESCNQVGIKASMATSMTAEIDIVIAGHKTSLKSENRIHGNVHISKFCELGWGDWATSDDLYYKIHRRSKKDTNRTFEARVDVYERMLSLRNERTSDGKVNYELVEVPIPVLRRILDIPKAIYKNEMAASQSRTLPKSFNIKIPWCDKSGARDIVVKFDGGGERKLTITLPKECADVIATWSFTSEV